MKTPNKLRSMHVKFHYKYRTTNLPCDSCSVIKSVVCWLHSWVLFIYETLMKGMIWILAVWVVRIASKQTNSKMGRTLTTPTPCCSYTGMSKGPWMPKEDLRLIKYIEAHGEGNWRTLPSKAGIVFYFHQRNIYRYCVSNIPYLLWIFIIKIESDQSFVEI